MNVYHGTGSYNLERLASTRPECTPRHYLGGRRAFSTTTDFEIAKLFALRRSSPGILRGDESACGVVIEYRLAKDARKGKDWMPARCPGVLQDEEEIAILNPEVLKFVAVWSLEDGIWVRNKAESRLKTEVRT